MANIKHLFNNNPKKILSSASLNDIGASIESADYVKRNFQDHQRFIPHVDFTSASNFAFYGSAEKYGDDAFTYISNEYPYDGSLKEKIEWELSGTYYDKYIFDSVYPRTTGYINHGLDYGTVVTIPEIGGGFYDYSRHEYIKFLGGPHTGSSNVSSNLTKNFTGSNVYKASVNQESNIELDGDSGFAVEFWFKKDAWVEPTGECRAQVILDIWNSSSATPGRLTIWADRSAPNVLFLEIVSGSVQTYISDLGSSLPIVGSDWNHYALNFENVGNDLQTKLYLNGGLNNTNTSTGNAIQKVTGSFLGYIGALTRATEVLGYGGEGYDKLSASLDEIRYWKTKRTPEQIARNWFTQVAGGTNTDYSTLGTGSTKYSPGRPVDLGIYYKFNEGIFDSGSANSKDAVVLDYSGRLSNGNWIGYSLGARSTGSAMIESSASATEFKDPILDLASPLVSASLSDLKIEGQFYDSTNNASIFHTLPGWIREDDLENSGEVLYKLTQIIGSYFDTLQLQIQSVPRLKDQNYFSGSYKPYPFTNRIIENLGFEVGELFTEADALESCASRDDFRNFEQKLNEVKNRIYSNLYNNLVGVLKSKGTEKAFRNIIRCYGIDENLVKLNLYADQSEYILRDNFDSSTIRKRYADFNAYNRVESTVYQSTSSVETANTRAYLSSSEEMKYRGNTFEAEVIFPQKISRELDNYFANNFVESSIFGAHTVNPASPNDDQWHLPDASNFVVSSVRPSRGSESVYFKLSASSGFSSFPVLTSSLINDVYTDTRWNLSVRVKPKANPYASDVVTGSMDYEYDVIFSGFQPIADSFHNSFTATGTLSNDAGVQFLTGSKKMFAGAHRTNFTGSTITKSDVKISSVRAWMDYLDDATVKFHAKDSANFGTKSPLKSAYMTPSGSGFFGKNVDKIPQLKTLAMDWDFETVTSSTAAGVFTVQDASSGSQADTLEYGWLGPISLYQHTGRGFGFPVSSTSSISREYVQTAKQLLPEVLNSSDMVNLVDSNDDSLFTRESRPITFFFAAEKSMYRIISDQILKIFATIVDFNNLIGEPVNRYRPEYKQLEKLRNAYFKRIENNTIDFEKFVDYYKWIDQSITIALLQIFPASADYSNKLWTMIESHILERNKYWTKFPLVKKFPATEGSVRGINELSYNWKFGHAPNYLPISLNTSSSIVWGNLINTTASANGGLNKGTGLTGYNAWASAPPIDQDDAFTVSSNFTTRFNSMYVGLNTSSAPEYDVSNWQFSWLLGGGLFGTDGSVAAKVDNATVWSCLECLDTTHYYRIKREYGKIIFQRSTDGSVTFDDLYTHESSCGNYEDLYPVFTSVTAGGSNTGLSAATASQGSTSNCLWWKDRFEPCGTDVNNQRNTFRMLNATTPFSTASISQSNVFPTLFQPDGTAYYGDVYGIRNFSQIYQFKVQESKEFKGGANVPRIKNLQYAHTELPFGTSTQLKISAPSIENNDTCNDVIDPNDKDRLSYKLINNPTSYKSGKGEIFAPFSLFSSSVTTGYVADLASNFKTSTDLVNYHNDVYGGDNEVPLQGPFTEKYVGGREYRHVRFPTTSSTVRPEAWDLDLELGNQKSIQFDNSNNNECITVASSSAIPAGFADGDFSVSVWVYGTGGKTTCDKVFDRGSSTWANGWGMNLGCSDSTKMTFWVGQYTRFAEAAFAEDEWVHYIATYNQSDEEFIIYRNGVAGTTQTRLAGAIRTTPLFIGNSDPTSTSNYTWPGYINDVVFWRNTLSQEEITAIYNDGCTLDPRFARTAENSRVARPVSWFRMGDDDTYPIIKNVINSAASGTMTNMAADDIVLASPCSSSNKLAIKTRTAHQPRSTILREPLAKRPVNIRNIRMTTGSTILGNYERSYELVQTNGRSINNRFFVKSGGFIPTASASTYLVNTVEYALPRFDLTGTNQYIFVNHFNAPGGPDVSSRGVLDYIAEEYAIYNDLNFRNSVVRDALKEWQTEYCGQFGIKPPNTASALNYDTSASYQKVNRNTRILAATTTTTGTLRDNWFVQHAIPQSAYQYSWITASVSKSATDIEEMAYGYTSNASIPSGTTSMTQSMPPFILASDSGSGPVLSDFVGLNTLIYDPLNSSERILSASDDIYRNDFLTGGLKQASVLNALLLHRNGPYQNPSWKQIRGYENPIVRNQRNNNILSMREQPSDSLYVDSKLGRRIDPGVSGTAVKFMPPFRSKTNKTPTTLWVTASLTEPPVSFKYKPIVTVLRSNDATEKCDFTYLAHSYGNNIATFANNTFIDLLAIDEDLVESRQNYHKIRKLYENNASAVLKKFTYGEVVYPRDVNTGLNKVRMRTNYAEVANSIGSNGINRGLLSRRTFWRNSRDDRIQGRWSGSAGVTTPAYNTLNFPDQGAMSVWPLDSILNAEFPGCEGASAGEDQYYPGSELIRYSTGHAVVAPMFFTGASGPDAAPNSRYDGQQTTASLLYAYEASYQTPITSVDNVEWVTNREAPYGSGINPWFDSYEEYSNDIKRVAKEFTILPEFKISDHVDYYVNENGGDFRVINNNFLDLDGASITSSADSATANLNQEFFATYSNSDFQKYFGTFSDDAALNKITLTCNGVKKLLPYNGFYPVLRTTQIGGILSQSLASSIGGIGIKDGQPISSEFGLSGTLSVQSAMQPFFAPGVMFNSIKSGIAVDWPVFTGSLNVSASTAGAFYVGGMITETPNYRIPFESLVSFADHIPISSSDGEGKVSLLDTNGFGYLVQGSHERLPYFDWNGSIKPTFEMATNNFLAEVPNFFLKDNSFTVIASNPENQFKTFKSGSSYYMDVFLEMPWSGSSRTVMFEGKNSPGDPDITLPTTTLPTSGSNPEVKGLRGKWFGPTYQFTSSYWQQDDSAIGNNLNLDPAQAPCTPPYYYGKSIATIKYVSDGTESGAGILEKILSQAEITYSNPELLKMVAGDEGTNSPAIQGAMMLSSSLNLLGKTRLKQIEYNLNQSKGNQFVPATAKDPADSSFDAWAISPKFETPILDFSNQVSCGQSGLLNTARGMWSGYGEFCTGSKGLILGIEETYPTLPQGSGENTTGLTGSLLKQCGFDSAKKREKVGEIADKKVISEAIVAIPYLEGSIPSKTSFAKTIGSPILQKWFFTLSGKTKKQSRKLYNQTKINVQNDVEPLTNLPFKTTDAITETSVSDLTEKMENYVIPPQLNFDLYSDIEPFVMYFMEFEHELDRQDLADIWQGVMPKISRIAEKDTSIVEHQVAPWEFFGGQQLPEGIKWMVFKVKKKAAINYFAATADSSDDDRFKFNFKNNKNAVPDYSYNWPYDYFSLVELAQIEVEDEFKTVRNVPGEEET